MGSIERQASALVAATNFPVISFSADGGQNELTYQGTVSNESSSDQTITVTVEDVLFDKSRDHSLSIDAGGAEQFSGGFTYDFSQGEEFVAPLEALTPDASAKAAATVTGPPADVQPGDVSLVQGSCSVGQTGSDVGSVIGIAVDVRNDAADPARVMVSWDVGGIGANRADTIPARSTQTVQTNISLDQALFDSLGEGEHDVTVEGVSLR